MFFDNYPRFLETSRVRAQQERLNRRYEAILAANKDVFDGARVLDLASHDGRWSFAALQTGAVHVTGVEARRKLVARAHETFAHYGQDPRAYRFVCGDVFDVLGREKLDVDVVLCLGYLYHTYRHTELLHRIRRLNPGYLIVDSQVVPWAEPAVKVLIDHPHRQGEAVSDRYSHAHKTLVGRPSLPALQTMLETYDFEVERIYDWEALLAAHPEADGVGDYAHGHRVTLRCRSVLSTHPAARKNMPASSHRRRLRRGWRRLVNRALAKTTGYELRRAATSD